MKVALTPDDAVEGNERFTVTLSKANAPIVDGSGEGAIREDD